MCLACNTHCTTTAKELLIQILQTKKGWSSDQGTKVKTFAFYFLINFALQRQSKGGQNE